VIYIGLFGCIGTLDLNFLKPFTMLNDVVNDVTQPCLNVSMMLGAIRRQWRNLTRSGTYNYSDQ
jgi:hypothetical protein